MKIEGYPGYEAWEDGTITKNGRPLKINSRMVTMIDEDGNQCCLCVAQVIAKCFLKSIPGKENVIHKDRNPLNNRVENLEWGSDADCGRASMNKEGTQQYHIDRLGWIKGERDDGTVQYFRSIRDAEEQIGIPKSTVQHCLSTGNRSKKHGWGFTRASKPDAE